MLWLDELEALMEILEVKNESLDMLKVALGM